MYKESESLYGNNQNVRLSSSSLSCLNVTNLCNTNHLLPLLADKVSLSVQYSNVYLGTHQYAVIEYIYIYPGGFHVFKALINLIQNVSCCCESLSLIHQAV